MQDKCSRSQFSETQTANYCAAPHPRKLRYSDQCYCQMLAWSGPLPRVVTNVSAGRAGRAHSILPLFLDT